jgi:hypothetical protein
VWAHLPIIPASVRSKRKDQAFQARLEYIEILSQKKEKRVTERHDVMIKT